MARNPRRGKAGSGYYIADDDFVLGLGADGFTRLRRRTKRGMPSGSIKFSSPEAAERELSVLRGGHHWPGFTPGASVVRRNPILEKRGYPFWHYIEWSEEAYPGKRAYEDSDDSIYVTPKWWKRYAREAPTPTGMTPQELLYLAPEREHDPDWPELSKFLSKRTFQKVVKNPRKELGMTRNPRRRVYKRRKMSRLVKRCPRNSKGQFIKAKRKRARKRILRGRFLRARLKPRRRKSGSLRAFDVSVTGGKTRKIEAYTAAEAAAKAIDARVKGLGKVPKSQWGSAHELFIPNNLDDMRAIKVRSKSRNRSKRR